MKGPVDGLNIMTRQVDAMGLQCPPICQKMKTVRVEASQARWPPTLARSKALSEEFGRRVTRAMLICTSQEYGRL